MYNTSCIINNYDETVTPEREHRTGIGEHQLRHWIGIELHAHYFEGTPEQL
jgi:hypothetical protein